MRFGRPCPGRQATFAAVLRLCGAAVRPPSLPSFEPSSACNQQGSQRITALHTCSAEPGGLLTMQEPRTLDNSNTYGRTYSYNDFPY